MYALVPHGMAQLVLKIEKLSHIIGTANLRTGARLRSPSQIMVPALVAVALFLSLPSSLSTSLSFILSFPPLPGVQLVGCNKNKRQSERKERGAWCMRRPNSIQRHASLLFLRAPHLTERLEEAFLSFFLICFLL